MSWFEKIIPSRNKTERRTRSVPEGLWIKCTACDAVLYRAELTIAKFAGTPLARKPNKEGVPVLGKK